MAARTPGTARIGSTLMNGLEGQMITARNMLALERGEKVGMGARGGGARRR